MEMTALLTNSLEGEGPSPIRKPDQSPFVIVCATRRLG
jgi:hypothetical protein